MQKINTGCEVIFTLPDTYSLQFQTNSTDTIAVLWIVFFSMHGAAMAGSQAEIGFSYVCKKKKSILCLYCNTGSEALLSLKI